MLAFLWMSQDLESKTKPSVMQICEGQLMEPETWRKFHSFFTKLVHWVLCSRQSYSRLPQSTDPRTQTYEGRLNGGFVAALIKMTTRLWPPPASRPRMHYKGGRSVSDLISPATSLCLLCQMTQSAKSEIDCAQGQTSVNQIYAV